MLPGRRWMWSLVSVFPFSGYYDLFIFVFGTSLEWHLRKNANPTRTPFFSTGRFPPLGHHAELSIHIRKFNKSMPLPQSQVQPFSDILPSSSSSSSPLPTTLSYLSTKPQTPSNIPAQTHLSKSQLLTPYKEFPTADPSSSEWLARELRDIVPRDELRYIRGDGGERGGGGTMFKTLRKYFIPSLSRATETVAAGQTFGFVD